MGAILDAGLRIPDDVALVGCANLPYDSFLRVPLTSVDQQSVAIGQRAARLALKLITADRTLPPRTILLNPTLVIRDSTKRRLPPT
jgi:LacI family transcriptional regulator